MTETKRVGWIIVAPTDIMTNVMEKLNDLKRDGRKYLNSMGYTKITTNKTHYGYQLVGYDKINDDEECVDIWEVVKK